MYIYCLKRLVVPDVREILISEKYVVIHIKLKKEKQSCYVSCLLTTFK